jgi:ribosomal peptide maturation radical SAM protein 1
MSLDVSLVVMPFGPLEQPGMGPSILKAALDRSGISSTVFYANLLWAEEIGFEICDLLAKLATHDLTPEWVFSEAAFPDFDPCHEEYFAHIGGKLDYMEQFILSPTDRQSLGDLLWDLRRRAPAFVDRMAAEVLEKRPRIVGCSSTYQQHCASLALLRRIKAADPEMITMIGGVNCESSMGVVTYEQCPWVDYVISGEADVVFPELCGRILRAEEERDPGAPLPGILGPDRCTGGERAARPPVIARVTDMEDSPTPDFDDYFSALESSSIREQARPYLPIETSRGCSWSQVSQCAFCGADRDGMFLRSKAPERVAEEIKSLSRRYGIDVFAAVDVNLDTRYFDTLLPALSEADDSYNILWMIRSDLSREQVALLSRAGFKWVFAGIESFDDAILTKLKKGTRGINNVQFLKWTQESGIFVGWLLLHSLPGDSDEPYIRLAEWLPLISHLQPPIGLVPIQYRRFSPYHTEPDEFDLNLGADPSYRYVFPFAQQDLDDLAYFLRERGEGLAPKGRLEGHPGFRRVRDRFLEWRIGWEGRLELREGSSDVSTLVLEDDGAALEIRDTRPCATEHQHHLDGLRRQVYLVCDRARNRNQILQQLSTEYGIDIESQELEPAIEDLLGKKLMLELGGTLLSLAVRGPLSIMRPYPRTWG